jgi:hypothetical protein
LTIIILSRKKNTTKNSENYSSFREISFDGKEGTSSPPVVRQEEKLVPVVPVNIYGCESSKPPNPTTNSDELFFVWENSFDGREQHHHLWIVKRRNWYQCYP